MSGALGRSGSLSSVSVSSLQAGQSSSMESLESSASMSMSYNEGEPANGGSVQVGHLSHHTHTHTQVCVYVYTHWHTHTCKSKLWVEYDSTWHSTLSWALVLSDLVCCGGSGDMWLLCSPLFLVQSYVFVLASMYLATGLYICTHTHTHTRTHTHTHQCFCVHTPKQGACCMPVCVVGSTLLFCCVPSTPITSPYYGHW